MVNQPFVTRVLLKIT